MKAGITLKTSTPQMTHHTFEPLWRTRKMLITDSVPSELAPWLFDEGSLTRRIIQNCNRAFRVEILSQDWQRPMLNEAKRLGVHPEHRALIREVLLYCGDTPWVFARSVIPGKTLTGPRRFLGKLDNRPLGAVLFSDPGISRDALEVAQIHPGQRMFSCATQRLSTSPDALWGRRSVFYLKKKPLLVNEIFLPSLSQ